MKEEILSRFPYILSRWTSIYKLHVNTSIIASAVLANCFVDLPTFKRHPQALPLIQSIFYPPMNDDDDNKKRKRKEKRSKKNFHCRLSVIVSHTASFSSNHLGNLVGGRCCCNKPALNYKKLFCLISWTHANKIYRLAKS